MHILFSISKEVKEDNFPFQLREQYANFPNILTIAKYLSIKLFELVTTH
jgi:hypothetical protein